VQLFCCIISLLRGAVTKPWIDLVFKSATAASRDFLAYSPPVKFGLPGVIITDSFQTGITFILRGMAC
jgi:hypothetical protein